MGKRGRHAVLLAGALAGLLALAGASGACAGSACGDGLVDGEAEQCDDGNNLGGDGCLPNCQLDSLNPWVPGCDAGDANLVWSGSCYMLFVSHQDWFEARTKCMGLGGYLVQIASSQENAQLSKFLFGYDPSSSAGTWIGLNDILTGGNSDWDDFYWDLGLQGAQKIGSYNNFAPGQPNDSGDCVQFWTSYQWNDQPCDGHKHFICERPL